MPTEVTVDELKSFSGEIDLGVSEWHRVEQKHIDLFADAIGDHQWIHVDHEAAKQGPFGQTIAHGYLSISLLPMLMAQVMSVLGAKMRINYGTNKVRFTNPVPSGSNVRLKAKLTDAQPKGDGLLYTVGVEIEIEGQQKPAMVGEVLYLVFA